ncbi:MAG: tRNA (N(6)-L-threonylcarbamoyladenosine(37)-C(2))-methylthiotransferase [Candidatus Paceibacterota bacterium]
MKFCLKTYGCKMNRADSELMRGILSSDFKEASEKEADLFILNSCGVVEKTERKILKEAAALKEKGKKVIISGCLPLISFEACREIADGLIGPTNISSIGELAEKVLKGKKEVIIGNEVADKAELCSGKKRTDKDTCSAIVSIAEGCLGSCSYCITRFARKRLNSFERKNIVKEIEGALSSEFKEIQLTSQDLAVYGMDKGKQDLPGLLEDISRIEGDFRVKLGMMNPGHAKKILKGLLSAYKSDKLYKFIHLPLQSGDDELLKKMNRGYSISDFLEIVSAFRREFKESIIATDIIVGHPLETEESFKRTVALIKKVKPEVLHIFKFSKRKGTPDSNLKDLPDRIKKDRSRIVSELFEKYNLEKNKKYKGKKLKVLIIEKRKGKCLARTDSGRAVVLDKGKIEERVEVKIVDYRWNYLIGIPSRIK